MKTNTSKSRRQFMAAGAAAGTVAACGGLARRVEAAPGKELDCHQHVTIALDGKQVRRVAAGENGRFYVAADTCVLVYSASGEKVLTIDLTRPVRAVQVDGQGQIYAATMHGVTVFDANGSMVSTWAELGKESIVSDLTVEKNEIYVTDNKQRKI